MIPFILDEGRKELSEMICLPNDAASALAARAGVPTLSIKQVAAELGFEHEAYSGHFFKKHTDLRPTKFRDLARRQLAAG